MTMVRTYIVIACAFALLGGSPYAYAKRHRPPAPPRLPNKDLVLAKVYAVDGDWKDAEAHFLIASNDPASRGEALAGVQNARREMDKAQEAPLAAAKTYEQASLWSKAEDIYRSVAIDSNTKGAIRDGGREGLERVLKKQEVFEEAGEWWDHIKTGLEMVAASFGVILVIATAFRIRFNRKKISVQGFSAPTDDLERSVALEFKYARETMANPALSGAGPFSAILVKGMFEFADEAEAIEDIEVAGASLPFVALAKLFGKPRVVIHGGFDGNTPQGEIWASIQTRGNKGDDFVTGTIAMTVATQQKSDLRNFAYTVFVRASTAYRRV